MLTHAKTRIGLVAALLALLVSILAASAVQAEDRATKVVTFESSAAHTAGTEYSSGFLVGAYAEAVILLNVTAVTGAPTLDLTLQTSDDNSTYYDLEDLGEATATGSTAYQASNYGKYVRVKQAISGVTSATYTLKGVFKN